jgi:hypothetical protein
MRQSFEFTSLYDVLIPKHLSYAGVKRPLFRN